MSSSRGFTLVEVMIAITVFSLIMLGALSAMRTLGKVNTRVVATAERSDELRSVNQVLRRLLEQMHSGGSSLPMAGTWGSPQAAGVSYFVGDAYELTWLAPLLGVAGNSGLHYVRLQRARNALLLSISPYVFGEDEPDWQRSISSLVLLEGVSGFEVAYRERPDGPWEQTFEAGERGGPQAIKLRIRAGDKYWPDLVVAPPALQGL